MHFPWRYNVPTRFFGTAVAHTAGYMATKRYALGTGNLYGEVVG
jgi:hypothetical protein